MAPKVTQEQSRAEIQALLARLEAAERTRDRTAELLAYRALLDHPCAHHEIDTFEVFDEIHRILRDLGRYDEAIEAKREAIAAGYRSTPDPEADIAECLLEAGRRTEAEALYTKLRERAPDDMWLYNSAGWAYDRVGDHDEALRWLLDGIEVAIRTGDPDQAIGQLLDMAREAWDRLGQPHDAALIARVQAFQRAWVRPRYRPSVSDAPGLGAEERRCDHCGYSRLQPERPAEASIGSLRLGEPSTVAVSLAWFPAEEWTAAMERWPHLTEDMPVQHDAYSRRIEAGMKRLARERTGQQLFISPLSVGELLEVEGERADTGAARAHLAAEVARTGRALAWPPGRNDPCWCGSGRKYKKCCGPEPARTDGEVCA